MDFVKELRSGDYTDLQTFNCNTTMITISHYMYIKRNIIYILYVIVIVRARVH